MEISLPPGTASYAKTGTLMFELHPLYLNCSVPSVKYSIRMWGFDQQIRMEYQGQHYNNNFIHDNQVNQLYRISFKVTTNLAKLTQFFKDMAVMVIVVADARSNKQIGLAYAKMKTYIINDFISEFDEKIDIVGHAESKNKKLVIGQLSLKLKLDVPIHVQPQIQPLPNNEIISQINNTDRNQTQGQSTMRRQKIQLNMQQNQSKANLNRGQIRKLMVQPHIFENITQQDGMKQFVINKGHSYTDRVPQKIGRNDEQKDIRQILKAMRTKPKITNSNVIDFMQQNSIDNYPSIEQLIKKYGNNNVCVERMKLKLDEAKYLTKKENNIQTNNYNNQNKGYVINFRNFNFIVGTNTGITDLSVALLVSQKDNTILNQAVIKNINGGGLYANQINPGNVIQLQNSSCKAKFTLRKINMEGEPFKIYLKKKQNNKKIAQIDAYIQTIGNQKQIMQNQQQDRKQYKEQINGQMGKSKKMHYYISVLPSRQSKYKQYEIMLHPQSQKQAAKSKKMIFSAANIPQKIKIIVNDNGNANISEKLVVMSPQIKMREQKVEIGKEEFKLFMCCAQNIQNLMNIVVTHDTHSKKQAISSSDMNSRGNVEQGKQPQAPQLPHSIQYSRQDKLKILYQCFTCLLQTNNSECMEIINKLLSVNLLPEQQLPLFERMCHISGVERPQLATQFAFKQLLHTQFSMFWSCFLQYRRWNQLYNHCMSRLQRQTHNSLFQNLGEQHQYNGSKLNSIMTKKLQKLIDKMYRCKQTLFGLIPYQSAQNIINSYIADKINININMQVQSNEVQNKQIRNKQRTQKIKQNMYKILDICCRYIGCEGSKHCIKIQQLANILLYNQQQRIYINEHQIQAIANNSKQQIQLLFQLTISCSVNKQCDYGCANLKQLLKQYEAIETESSRVDTYTQGRLQTQDRLQTQGRLQTQTHMNHLQTQQQERLHTDQISVNQHKKINIDKINNIQQSNVQNNTINVCFSNLILNPNQNKYVTVPNLQQTKIQVTDFDTKQIKASFIYNQLPKVIPNLINLRDYKVYVTLQSEQLQNILQLQGVFIASNKLQRITLYHCQSGKQLGTINVGIAGLANSQDQFDDEVIALQIKKQQQFKYNDISYKQKTKEQELKKRQQQQEERQKLTKQKQANITDRIFNAKILSIFPAARANQQYLIQLQGAEGLINYSHSHSAQVNNINPTQKYMRISVKTDGLRVQSWNQKLTKSYGVHEICLNKDDGSVGCVVTLQLEEYKGQMDQFKQSNLQRVIFMNLYHIQTYAKSTQHQHSLSNKLTLVATTESNVDPIVIKQIDLLTTSIFARDGTQQLRHIWVGITERLPINSKYDIFIYTNFKGSKYIQQNLLAHFQFKIKFHPDQMGIFQHKGYLVDEKGYRLALNLIQINYNDIFSKDAVGRNKFQNILTVFRVQNMLNIGKSSPKNDEELKSRIQSNLGFNNTQLHLLFQLQTNQNQIRNIINNWDIDSLLSAQSINLQAYSIHDLFSQYELYDFTSSGIIPFDKANLLETIIFKNKQNSHRIKAEKCKTHNKEGWMIDLKFVQKTLQIDYLLVLWNLRKFAVTDDFFFKANNDNTSYDRKKKIMNDTTKYNNTPLLNNDSISKIKSLKIYLLGYKNLKVDNQPGTLIFYINGEKVAEPIPRCFTHQYDNSVPITTSWPILLEIYNKKYGVKQLYSEQLIETVKVYEEKVRILDGQIYFMIQQDSGESSINEKRKKINEMQSNSKQKQELINKNSLLKQSRVDKWKNFKQQNTKSKIIADILKSKVTV